MHTTAAAAAAAAFAGLTFDRPSAQVPPTPSPSPIAGARPSPSVDGTPSYVELDVEVEAETEPHPPPPPPQHQPQSRLHVYNPQQHRVRDVLSYIELSNIKPFDRYAFPSYGCNSASSVATAPFNNDDDDDDAGGDDDDGMGTGTSVFGGGGRRVGSATSMPLLTPLSESGRESPVALVVTSEEQVAQLEHEVSGLVAHEVAMDHRYRITLPVNHAQGLEFALLARRIARDPTDSAAVAAVVADLQRGLLCATTAHGGAGHDRLRGRIRSNLDPVLLASQVAHGVFDQVMAARMRDEDEPITTDKRAALAACASAMYKA